MAKSVHEHDPNVGEDSARDEQFNAFKLGRAMEEFCEKVPAGKHLVESQTEALQLAINEWLAEDDPSSVKARAAHFRARVAVELLNVIQSAIKSGKQAESLLLVEEAGGERS